MKKTIAEWFVELPKTYRLYAMENCTNYFEKVKDKADALEKGFEWNDTRQGHEFWNTRWNNLINAQNKKSKK